MSASSKTMLGDFPPSSRVTVFKLDAAAAFMICRPTAVDPVKATCDESQKKELAKSEVRRTFSIFMCEEMAAPTVAP